jgi:hypothetical protein
MVDAASAPSPDVVVVEAEASDGIRSPVDLLRLLVAVVLVAAVLVADMLFGGTLATFASDLFAGLSAVPDWIVDVVVVGSRVLAAVLLVVGLAVLLRTGRWRVAATLGLAALVAAGLTALLDVFESAPADAPVAVVAPGFPSAPGLAAVSAAVTAAAPWLPRGWRQWSWVAVGGLTVTRFLSTPASLATLEAVLIGWLVGAAAVVALGGPWRRPRGHAVAAGLADVGVPLARLEQASLDARGSTPYFAETTAGDRLFVKALGDDERSADRLFRLYRRVVPRDLGDERPFSTLRRAVEHEALVALTARDVGVRTPRLVAVARARPHGFTLAYEAIEGRSLDRLDPSEVTDDVLAAVWDQVAILRARRIAHRDLRLANIFLAADGQVWLIDFGFSELAVADVLLATDVAELVTSSAVQVGAARAVERAVAAVDGPTLAAARDRLHPWALSGATREALRERAGLLDDVRDRLGAAG